MLQHRAGRRSLCTLSDHSSVHLRAAAPSNLSSAMVPPAGWCSVEAAQRAVDRASSHGGIKLDGSSKKLKVNFSPPNDQEAAAWPPPNHKELERPPIPV